MTTGSSTSTLAKGCGIAALIFTLLLGGVAYGGWRLWKSLSDADITAKIGDSVTRSIADGLAKAHFDLTPDNKSGKSTSTSKGKYTDGGRSTSSECLSPILKATPKDPAQWATPNQPQRQAVLKLIAGASEDLLIKYQGELRVNTKENMVSSHDARAETFCVAQFSTPLPLK